MPGSTPCNEIERRLHEEQQAKLRDMELARVGERKLWGEWVDPGCVDHDFDMICDYEDNCPAAANSEQRDSDYDGVGDVSAPLSPMCCATP